MYCVYAQFYSIRRGSRGIHTVDGICKSLLDLGAVHRVVDVIGVYERYVIEAGYSLRSCGVAVDEDCVDDSKGRYFARDITQRPLLVYCLQNGGLCSLLYLL